MNRKRSGFAVVAVLIFVAAIAARISWEKKPKLLVSNGFAASITLSNAKQVCLCMQMYASDYDDLIPYAPDTGTAQAVIYPYSKSRDIWKSLNPKGGQIEFNTSVAGVNSAKMPEAQLTPLVYDSEAWEGGGRPVGFCDGHGATVTGAKWKELTEKMKLQKFTHVGQPLKPQHL